MFVKSIMPGSAADRDGRLRPGDQILEVNKQSLENLRRDGFFPNDKHKQTSFPLCNNMSNPNIPQGITVARLERCELIMLPQQGTRCLSLQRRGAP